MLKMVRFDNRLARIIFQVPLLVHKALQAPGTLAIARPDLPTDIVDHIALDGIMLPPLSRMRADAFSRLC